MVLLGWSFGALGMWLYGQICPWSLGVNVAKTKLSCHALRIRKFTVCKERSCYLVTSFNQTPIFECCMVRRGF